MRTGRSGSPQTGSPRCASRSGCGSTRSSSCRSCSPDARRSSVCSGTRRCSTRRAARCTARGGTRSLSRTRSRPRFWDGDDAALGTLWYGLVQTLRVLSPVMPFLTDHLWRNLVPDGPESVHLAPWPDVVEPDRTLLDEMSDVRRVVTLAHQARSASGLKLRQPLHRLVVESAAGARAHAEEIADEVRVKDVVFDKVDAELRV